MIVSLKVFCCLAAIQSLLLRSSVVAFHQFTVPHRILWNHAYKTKFEQDWRSCILVCQEEEKCISTNYLLQTASGEETTGGLCELNDEGVPDDKVREFGLIHSKGWMYHQMRSFKPTKQSGIPSNENKGKGTDNCASGPCLNNGTCSDGVESYSCTCLTDFSGNHCQFSDNCNATWKLVYEHSEDGTALQGDVQTLQSAVLAGARVRVLTTKDGDVQASEADGLYEKDGHVYAELQEHVGKKTWNTFERPAYWWWMILSTDGNAHTASFPVGSDTFRDVNHTHMAAKWFVKYMQKPILSSDKDGNKLYGNLTALQDAVRSGHEIRCIVDKHYVFPLHNVNVSDLVAGQRIDRVDKAYQNNSAGFIFNTKAFWYITYLSSAETRHTCVAAQAKCNRAVLEHIALDWYSDTCWKHVYTSTAASSGTNTHDQCKRQPLGLKTLVSAITGGARVRFQIPSWNHYTAEADNLSIRGNQVTAQALKRIGKTGESEIVWVWLMVSTTGIVRVARHSLGATGTKSDSTEAHRIDWFVDTRTKELVLEHDRDGNITKGNSANLVKAVGQGVSVRCVRKVQSDTFAFEAQNLAIHGIHIAAQALNHVSMEKLDSCEKKIQSDPYWFFTIVDTTGRIEKSRWKIGKHESYGVDDNEKVGQIKWFVYR